MSFCYRERKGPRQREARQGTRSHLKLIAALSDTTTITPASAPHRPVVSAAHPRRHTRIPSVALPPSPLAESPSASVTDITLTLDANGLPSDGVSAYHVALAEPTFWHILPLAPRAWEDLPRASKGMLTASEVPRTRDRVGVNGMAGDVGAVFSSAFRSARWDIAATVLARFAATPAPAMPLQGGGVPSPFSFSLFLPRTLALSLTRHHAARAARTDSRRRALASLPSSLPRSPPPRCRSAEVWLISSAATDLCIASTLAIALRSKKNSFAATDTVVDKIVQGKI
ncbi:hypothetical protein B0H14DRAFT_3727041 [Mycena olivaceomarginata]|nr:hypothetical protein B0H14DRAFT_3727041 [Mycena olivaceomarginata]